MEVNPLIYITWLLHTLAWLNWGKLANKAAPLWYRNIGKEKESIAAKGAELIAEKISLFKLGADTLISSLIGGLISWAIIYFIQTPVLPFYVLLTFLAMLCLNLYIRNKINQTYMPGVEPTIRKIAYWIFILATVGAIVITGFSAQSLHEIPPIVNASGTGNISFVHMRQVPDISAIYPTSSLLGEYGDKYAIDNAHTQAINGSLTLLLPIKYDGEIKAWQHENDGTPGYFMVNAENPAAEPIRVISKKMKYVPSAVFDKDLGRLIYYQYPNYWQKEPIFQLNGTQPIYVTMLTKPTIMGLIGEIPVGIVVTDPVNGTMELHDMDNIPNYVQRAISEKLVEQYVDWWSSYGLGLRNYLLGQEGVKVPTGAIKIDTGDDDSDSGRISIKKGDMHAYTVMCDDGRLYYCNILTTPGSENSMVGYILTDTNKWPMRMDLYKLEGTSDIGAARKLQGLPEIATAMGYHATEPVPYYINGTAVWIGPVISKEQDQVEMFGLVVLNGKTSFLEPSAEEAINAYRLWQKDPSRIESDTITIKIGDLDKLAQENAILKEHAEKSAAILNRIQR